MRQRNVFWEGVELNERRTLWIPLTSDGRECRDRLPWGGLTFPTSCTCSGRCQYDEERAAKEKR